MGWDRMKRKVLAMIIISIFLGGVVSYFYNDRSIGNIESSDIDAEGNYYYLQLKGDRTYLQKIGPDGTILIHKKLPSQKDGYRYSYTEMVVDQKENIYLLTMVERKESELEKEIIQRYDPKGNTEQIIYTLRYPEDVKQATEERKLNYLQLGEDALHVFCLQNPLQIDLLHIPLDSSQKPKVEKKLQFSENLYVSQLLYTPAHEIYFTTRKGEMYCIGENSEVKKIPLEYSEGKKVIPYTISADLEGNVYFTDSYNRKFVKINQDTRRIQVLYNKADEIAGENITFGQLRKVRVIDANDFIGQSEISKDTNKFIVTFGESEKVLDEIHSSIRDYMIIFIIGFLICFGSIFFLTWIYVLLRGKIPLIIKQILIFIPVLIIIMFGFIRVLDRMNTNILIDELYSQIYSVAKVTSNLMDGEKFKNLDFPTAYRNNRYNEIEEQVDIDVSGIDQLLSNSYEKNVYYVTYYLKHNQLFVGVSYTLQAGTPIDYIYDSQARELYNTVAKTGKIKIGQTQDPYGNWMFALAPIRDDQGKIVGVLERGVDGDIVKGEVHSLSWKTGFMNIGITFIIILLLLFMLKYSLRSLKVLEQGVLELAAGKWNAKVKVKSKDEFEDIGNAFNKMSSYIQEYVQELTELNDAYAKFVPQEFFRLLHKRNVLDVQLGDQAIQQMNVVYIHTRDFYELSKHMTTQQNFDFLNTIFNYMTEIVKQNGGVVERYEGAGMVALFDGTADYAVRSALQILERVEIQNRENTTDIEIGISIHHGAVMLGIVGHTKRVAPTVISEEVNMTLFLENLSKKFGTRLLITEDALREVPHKEKFLYRQIGRIKDNQKKRVVSLYDFIDGESQYDKGLKLRTKEQFETGIRYYMAGEFLEARKQFIDVIRVNRKDELAKIYLFLCEKYQEEPSNENWEGVLDYF